MTRTCAAVACLLLVAGACSSEERALRGIQTRVFVDRTEARVGDAVGVTIEIEAPNGFRVDRPAPPPPDERFLTESLEPIEPLRAPGGVRHRLLWTLRARSVGEHRLPLVEVPLVFPDGRTEPLPIGGTPLPVRSVRDELPAQETYFDIRPPPEPTWLTRGVLAGLGAAAAAVLALGVVLVLRRRRSEEPEPSEHALARSAIEAIEQALAVENPRRLADAIGDALYVFSGARFGVATASAVPEDLEPVVDPALVALIRDVERMRFARATSRDSALQHARKAREYLQEILPAARGPAGVVGG
jgi:hypothetical protein